MLMFAAVPAAGTAGSTYYLAPRAPCSSAVTARTGSSARAAQARRRPGDLEQLRDAGCVVDGAVEDLITPQPIVLAEMIPVRRVDDVLVGAGDALELADYVP
jgi:hypothetical protein